MRSLQDISVQFIKGVGPSRKKLFSQLGIENVEDLLYFFPRRYEDRRQMTKISDIKLGQWQTVAGKVVSQNSRQAWVHAKHVSEVVISDGQTPLVGVWFNQPYIANYFKPESRAVFYGKAEIYKDRIQMIAPEYEIIDEEEEENLSIGRIVPVYPLTRGLTQRSLRKIIKFCLDRHVGTIPEAIPYSLREKHGLLNLAQSILNLHFPESFELQAEAYKRISFEEFFLFQVSVFLRKASVVQKKGMAHEIESKLCEEFINSFDFTLTRAQKKAIGEIATDMRADCPMHRLLQGDVGSGKTLVAFFGCVAAKRNGNQSAFMAPTEILAKQHFDVLSEIARQGPFKDVRLALLVSDMTKKEREAVYQKVKTGEIDVLIGTHAIIQEGLEFKNLSFVVIDEQHKFGVRQRALLPSKGINPDVLIMTATPIPRTLCLTLYGDLDISVLGELPQGRGTIKTILFREDDAAAAYGRVRDIIKQGQQAYIVYPIIEESARLDLKAAKAMFEYFKKEEFKDFRIGLVHGQMKRKVAQAAMDDFKNKKIDILIATTVLEVGVDVPNATVMVIEHADRFGLSQLHQLRGRIGRGAVDSLCILIGDPATPEAKARLDAILSSTDGFKIAEQDLLIRGPGEFFGRHQHGINELKIANPATQLDILELTRKEAMGLVEADPRLENKANHLIKATIEKRYPAYLSLVMAG